ncbi:MAG: MFS transporter [Actinomycetota bacterium]
MTSLVRHRDFVRLWSAQSISQLGSQVSNLALPLVAVIALNASAFRVALLGTVEMLPFLFFALPAGVWVDRLARRPILVAADIGRALALGSVPIAAVVGHVTIWQLYAVGFVTGTLTVFFDVAYQSYLPSLVTKEQLVEGNSKLEFSRSGAQIAGPGLAGLLIDAITAPYAVAVDAVSFGLSALLAGSIRAREAVRERTADRSMRGEIAEGLRYLLGDPRWRWMAAYVATFNFGSGIVGPLLLVYAVRRQGLSPAQLGLVFMLGNVGWLVGAVVARRATQLIGTGATLALGGTLGGAPIVLWPLAPHDLAIVFAVAALAISSFGIVLFNIPGISLYQTLVPEHILGRMNASRRWIVWGVIPLGSLLGGVLASATGVRTTLFVGCAIETAASLFLLAKPIRTIATVVDDAGIAGDGSVAPTAV